MSTVAPPGERPSCLPGVLRVCARHGWRNVTFSRFASSHEAGKVWQSVGYVCDENAWGKIRDNGVKGELNMYKCNKSSDDYVEMICSFYCTTITYKPWFTSSNLIDISYHDSGSFDVKRQRLVHLYLFHRNLQQITMTKNSLWVIFRLKRNWMNQLINFILIL